MPACSGLSALILAATSQLGHLVEPPAQDDYSRQSSPYGDGDASSSDGDVRASAPPSGRTVLEQEGQTVSFPEQLMTQLCMHHNSDTLTFLPDGSFFALRVKEFSESLLSRYFRLSSFEEFLELMQGWGFSIICGEGTTSESAETSTTANEGIQVFRHPYFKRGAKIDLAQMQYQQSSSATGERSRIEHTLSDDSSASAKRPLSPSHVSRDFKDTSMKHRMVVQAALPLSNQDQEGDTASVPEEHRQARRRSSTEIRSYALAVTTSQLNLRGNTEEEEVQETVARRESMETQNEKPLVVGGVERATKMIVTDAIETLLFDVSHTRETYLKHEKELSTSSLPGVVPITKQLFSPPDSSKKGNSTTVEPSVEQYPQAPKSPPPVGESESHESLKENVVSPSRLHAAAVLVNQQAGLKGVVWRGLAPTETMPPKTQTLPGAKVPLSEEC